MPFGDGHEEIALDLKEQVLILKVTFNGNDTPPTKWHWEELLGLDDYESIELLGQTEITDVS